MPNEETVEATPSAEFGNIPVDAPNPEPTPVVEPVVPPVEPTVPEETLYELPDGRKVDADTLTKEWKENFLPDYTRKSQALAAKGTEPLQTTPSENPLDNPDWVPGSYKELVQIAKESALKEIQEREQKSVQERTELENVIATQLSEIKATDSSLNENELFLHATKYGFKDLKVAHQNMKDMKALVKTVQDTTVKNIAKKNDPVSMSPGATGAKPNPSNFSTARDYMKSL